MSAEPVEAEVPVDQETIVQVLAYRKVVGNFIREAFALAVETGSELLVLSSFKGAVSTWATPKLDPLVNDEGGRKVIAALLKEQLKHPVAVPPSEDAQKEQEEDAKWSETLNFIEDPPKRLEAFQVRISTVLKITRDLPEAFPGAEACALVATLGGKIFSFASPALKPLIESKQGRGLIMAMLGDPDAQKLLEENMKDLQERQKEHFAKVTAAAAAAQSEAESSQAP